jgi:phosphoribosylaminoimidazolecarboxamide formyltransferase/IMP cyclohydrolase
MAQTALLASYEKDDNLLRLGKILKEHGWTILGSSGTAAYLNDNGIPCRDVAEIVGKPILGHRVVTLSREIHAALLGKPENAEELKALGIEPIDLVYVTLYPLEKAIASAESPEEIIEKTDIGGPTLLRAAAKGRRIVLSSGEQIGEFEQRLKNGTVSDKKYLMALGAAAERRVAVYAGISADYWERATQ